MVIHSLISLLWGLAALPSDAHSHHRQRVDRRASRIEPRQADIEGVDPSNSTSIPGDAAPTTTPNSTNTTPSIASATVALGLASPILVLAHPECTNPGGDCAKWQSTVSQCEDDICICSNPSTLAAQICAQCSPDPKRIEAYNAFLQACVNVGLATANQTLTVNLAIPTVSPPAQIVPEPAVVTNTSIYRSPITSPATVQITTMPPTTSLRGNTTNPGLLEGVPGPGGPNRTLEGVGESIAPIFRETDATPVLSTSQSSISTRPTLALAASRNFFAQSIIPNCAVDCRTWQEGFSTCTDDACICTSAIRSSAAGCSSCMGRAGNSPAAAYAAGMAAYSQYIKNCSTVVALTPSPTINSAALEHVPGPNLAIGTGLAEMQGGSVAIVTQYVSAANPSIGLHWSFLLCATFAVSLLAPVLHN